MSPDLERGVMSANDHVDEPPSGPNQLPSGQFDFWDTSAPLFSMYSKISEEEDNKTVERLRKDVDVTLIFAGLFSAAVAGLLTVTVPDLRPNPHALSAFYLEKMYLFAHIQAYHSSIPSTVAQPPAFSPPRYAVWVNTLWFLSLVISLTYAMLATMVHQWVGRYITTTQQLRYSVHKRARVRALFSDSVGGFPVVWADEGLRIMIHLSLFLFFAGLIIFLFNINYVAFKAVMWSIGLPAMAYICITIFPIFRPNSSCYGPLSPIIWSLYTGILCAVFKVLSSMVGGDHRFHNLKTHYHNRFSDGIGKTAEKIALELAPKIDVCVLGSTLDTLGEDGSRARYFAAVPGFFNSEQVNNLKEHLPDGFRIKFERTLDGFLDRTVSSNLVSESFRSSQLLVCLKATHVVLGRDGVLQILCDILSERWPELLQSVEMAHTLRRWSDGADDDVTHYVRRIVTRVVAGVRERDDRWIALAKAEFGVPDQVLRDNLDHGDSALFALLIHITRQAFHTGSWIPFILLSLTQFDICDTLPELQHEFCALWNAIVHEAWKGGPDSVAVNILREIRHAYIGLHQDTEAAPTAFFPRTNYYNPVLAQPFSYRFCNIRDHRPDGIHQVTDRVTSTIPPIPTRTSNAFLPPPIAQPVDSPNTNPPTPSTPREIQRSPDDIVHTAPQEAEQATIIPRSPSPAYLALRPSAHTLSHRRTFPPLSRSRSISPVRIAQQVTSYPMEVFRHPPQSVLSIPDIATDSMRAHEPTPHICYSKSEDISRPHATTSLAPSHPSSPPTTSSPSIGLNVPFSDIGLVHTSARSMDGSPPTDTPDAPLDSILTATTPHPPGGNFCAAVSKEDIATPSAAPCISETPTAKPIPQSILANGAKPQRSKEPEIHCAPAIVVSDSQSSVILPSALCGDETPSGLDSSLESTLIPPDHISHPLGSMSLSPTAVSSHMAPPASSVLDVHGITSIGAPSTLDDTYGHCPSIAMESALPVSDVEDRHHDTKK